MNIKFIGSLKNNFFPIKKEEITKILSICLLKGLLSSVYCIFLNLKDVIIVSAEGSNAEALSVIRGFLVLPFSIILVIIYSNFSNRLKPTTIFYFFMFFFGVSLLIYSFILRPYEDFFSPKTSAVKLLQFLGENNKHWVAVYKNWMHAFFYILSELWVQCTIFILFWEFVNRVCNMDEAKRSYNLFIAAGGFFNFTTAFFVYQFMKYFKASFNLKFQIITIYMNICIIALMFTYYFLNKNKKIQVASKFKTKLSFIEGLKHIISSKYLICLAIITISLGLSSNLLAITWKANLKNLYSSKKDFINFMIKVNSSEHFIATILLIFVSGRTIRNQGWKVSASIPPIVILTTGSLFFLSSKFRMYLDPVSSFFGLTTLKFIALLGAFQVLSTKVSKYCFHDMTKEMAYIPLDNESRVKGKAAIDTIGSRLGKSASSYIHLIILWLAGTGSVLDITIYLIPILLIVGVFWMFSINFIAKYIDGKKNAI